MVWVATALVFTLALVAGDRTLAESQFGPWTCWTISALVAVVLAMIPAAIVMAVESDRGRRS